MLEAPPRAGRVLLVDDEQRVLDFLARALAAEGFETDSATDGEDAYQLALANDYDLIILDLLIPGSSGKLILSRLMHRRPNQRVIVLSCLSDTRSKVECLELGAEDYIPKPFALDELLARVKARMRERYRQPPTRLQVGDLVLDLLEQELTTPEGTVALTRRECLVLSELMRERGGIVSKERLLSQVWHYHFDPVSNVVDVYIRRLRAKLPPGTIQTVRSRGYRIGVA